MKQIQLSRHFWEGTFQPALLQWKAGKTREKVKSIVLEMLFRQRKEGHCGHKRLINERCIDVPAWMIREMFADSASQVKFTKWVISTGLVIKDRSWVSCTVAKATGMVPRCDSWHIADPDDSERITVDFYESFGLFGVYSKALRQAEGMKVQADEFHGVWAIEDYEGGKMSWGDFVEVGNCARNLIKGNTKQKGPSFRVYDAFAMCKKDLRRKCFLGSTGRGVEEFSDISGAATFTSTLAAAALGYTSVTDKDVIRWANHLSWGEPHDPYEQLFNGIKAIDPRTNCYRKWDKATRKTLKMDFQCIANCDLAYLRDCGRAYRDYFNKKKVNANKRRQWLVWKSIEKVNKPLYDCILRTKASECKGAFFRLHTMGEKMIMEELLKAFNAAGICVHRVHDALWTSDERLLKAGKEQAGKIVGDLILRVFKDCADYERKGINRLKSCITKEEEAWVREGMTLEEAKERVIKNAKPF